MLDGLWEYEVVELFIAGHNGEYVELELGPHGHSLLLRFAGVRQRARTGVPPTTTHLWGRVDGVVPAWWAEAVIPAAWLPPQPWRANAFAIHGNADQRRYLLAHRLPGVQPDFHQPQLFPAWPD
jgi:hypothetical protein